MDTAPIERRRWIMRMSIEAPRKGEARLQQESPSLHCTNPSGQRARGQMAQNYSVDGFAGATGSGALSLGGPAFEAG